MPRRIKEFVSRPRSPRGFPQVQHLCFNSLQRFISETSTNGQANRIVQGPPQTRNALSSHASNQLPQ
eukprot:7466-Eustigmatos_ZCMA.PRE.1